MTAAGLTLTRQTPADAVATAVDIDAPPSEVYAQLGNAEGFRAALIDGALDAGRGRTLTAFLDALDAAGVEALGGSYATLVARTARGERPAVRDLLRATARLGSGRSPLEDVHSPARLLALADGVTPTIDARLDLDCFRDLRAEQRREVCELLAELAEGADVRVVGTGLALRWLLREHRTDLPAGVDESSIAPQKSAAKPQLDPDAIPTAPTAVLEALDDEPSDTLTYGKLARWLRRERSTVRYHVTQSLVPAGAVERVDHYGEAAVRLTHAGRAYLDETRRQRSLEDYTERSVEGTGHASGNAVLSTPTHEGEGEAGLHTVDFLGWPDHHRAAGAAVEGDAVLVSHDVERAEDPGSPGWSFDVERDELVIAAEYQNPLQWWVCSALALTHARTFELVLDADRLDAVLEERGRAVLRDARQIGWLSMDVATGEELADALTEAREHLADLTRKLRHEVYEDRDRFRSAITKDAIGLASTMVHLLDAAGVDVVRELRLPEFTRNFDADRRAALVRTVAKGVAIQSTYGEFAAYRHLYESREDKRRTALAPRVDAADPEGEGIGSWVLVGPGVDDIEGELATALRTPRELHEDAPEFRVPVEVATPSRSAYAAVTGRLLRWKSLRPTRDAVSMLMGYAASPYAVGDALAALSREDHREVRLDEVRFALATLPPEQLLPDALPSIRAMLKVLLDAERPLTQAELADRAGISTRSVRRHADRLAALDLVRRTGDGWRLLLSFHTAEERHADIRPWYVTENRDRDDSEDATVAGVLWRAVDDLDPPPEVALMAGRGDVDGLRRAWSWLDGLLELLAALTVHEDVPDRRRTVAFGAQLEQTSLRDDLTSTQNPGVASGNPHPAA